MHVFPNTAEHYHDVRCQYAQGYLLTSHNDEIYREKPELLYDIVASYSREWKGIILPAMKTPYSGERTFRASTYTMGMLATAFMPPGTRHIVVLSSQRDVRRHFEPLSEAGIEWIHDGRGLTGTENVLADDDIRFFKHRKGLCECHRVPDTDELEALVTYAVLLRGLEGAGLDIYPLDSSTQCWQEAYLALAYDFKGHVPDMPDRHGMLWARAFNDVVKVPPSVYRNVDELAFLSDCAMVWKHAFQPIVMERGRDYAQAALRKPYEGLKELCETAQVKPKIEAVLAGVPVADILA